MKKKVIVALLACTMISLTACGDTKENENTTEENTVTSETPETPAADDSFYTSDIDLSVEEEPEVAKPVIETDDIVVGEYNNIEIDKVEVTEVKDEDVQSKFDSDMEEFNKEVEVTDRDTLESGDIADIDFVGKIDGEEFEGGSAQGYKLELGSGSFIDGFKDGLVGVKKGETKSLDLTFPENYSNTDYAGKAVVFDVTVNGIYKTEKPDVTDEFVKANTDYETIDAYKANLREQMEESNQNTALNNKRSAIWSALVSNCAVKKYDEEKIKKYVLEYKDYMSNMISSSYGISFDDYLTASGLTAEDFKQTAVTNAKAATKEQLILDAIADKENITVSDEEYQEYLSDYMENMGVSSEDELWSKFEAQGYVKEDVEKSMKDSIIANKVIEFLETTVVEK